MPSLSDDDVRKRLLEQPRFELAAKGVQSGKMLHLLAGRSRYIADSIRDSIRTQTVNSQVPIYYVATETACFIVM